MDHVQSQEARIVLQLEPPSCKSWIRPCCCAIVYAVHNGYVYDGFKLYSSVMALKDSKLYIMFLAYLHVQLASHLLQTPLSMPLITTHECILSCFLGKQIIQSIPFDVLICIIARQTDVPFTRELKN